MRRKVNQSTSSFRTTDFLKDQIKHYASETDKSDSTFIRDAVFSEIKSEPSRVCRRLQLLRGWSYDKENIGKIFT